MNATELLILCELRSWGQKPPRKEPDDPAKVVVDLDRIRETRGVRKWMEIPISGVSGAEIITLIYHKSHGVSLIGRVVFQDSLDEPSTKTAEALMRHLISAPLPHHDLVTATVCHQFPEVKPENVEVLITDIPRFIGRLAAFLERGRRAV